MPIRVKRIYESPEPSDGHRVLVDRIWPRGVSREKAAIDEWLKEIAPSTELRRWFGHEPSRWPEFRRRYAGELARRPDLLAHVRLLGRKGVVTLLYSARDRAYNQAVALAEILDGDGDGGDGGDTAG